VPGETQHQDPHVVSAHGGGDKERSEDRRVISVEDDGRRRDDLANPLGKEETRLRVQEFKAARTAGRETLLAKVAVEDLGRREQPAYGVDTLDEGEERAEPQRPLPRLDVRCAERSRLSASVGVAQSFQRLARRDAPPHVAPHPGLVMTSLVPRIAARTG